MATWKKVLTTAPLSEDIAASPAATKILTSAASGAVPTWEAPAASTIDALTDTDFSGGNAAVINEHLLFNGTNWVSAPHGTVFTFDVTGFSVTGITSSGTDVIIGVGDYKAIEYPVIGEMGTSSQYAARQSYTATAFTDGTTPETFSTTLYVDFSNNVYYGLHTANSSLTATNVTDDLTGAVTSITNDLGNHSVSDSKVWSTVDVTSDKYFVFACPTRCITGTNTLAFKDNSTGLAVDMEAVDTMDITNGSTFEEEYSVFVTTNHSLGNLTIKTER